MERESFTTDAIYERLMEMEDEIKMMVARCDHPEDLSIHIGCVECNRRHGEKYAQSSMGGWYGEGVDEKATVIDYFLSGIDSSVLVEKVVENERAKYRDSVYKSVITLKNFAEKLEKAV